MQIGEIYTTSGENPRTCLVVWVSGSAYRSYFLTPEMQAKVQKYGKLVLFWWIVGYHAGRWLDRIRSELTYSQW